MALRVTTSFLAVAMMATLTDFRAAWRCSRKCRIPPSRPLIELPQHCREHDPAELRVRHELRRNRLVPLRPPDRAETVADGEAVRGALDDQLVTCLDAGAGIEFSGHGARSLCNGEIEQRRSRDRSRCRRWLWIGRSPGGRAWTTLSRRPPYPQPKQQLDFHGDQNDATSNLISPVPAPHHGGHFTPPAGQRPCFIRASS